MPIIIIADDFSGAAELAGISLNYSLTAEVCFAEVLSSSCDVLIICTDSRSKKMEEALIITEDVLKAIKKTPSNFIYKKIDSALRGFIIEEASLQMKILGKNKALIIPANPSLNRIIKNKEYFINGIKINETAFASDPEFSVKDADVEIHFKNNAVIRKCKDLLQEGDIIIGETETSEDVNCWAAKTDDSMALIGAGDFYAALLNKKITKVKQEIGSCHLPHLYISGTKFENNRNLINDAFAKGSPVFYLTAEMLNTTEADPIYFEVISEKLKQYQKLILAIDDASVLPSMTAEFIRQKMGDIVEKILMQNHIAELFIEGGSTAGVILERLHIKRVVAEDELMRGVVRMRAGNLLLTVKPGSYELPEMIKQLYQL